MSASNEIESLCFAGNLAFNLHKLRIEYGFRCKTKYSRQGELTDHHLVEICNFDELCDCGATIFLGNDSNKNQYYRINDNRNRMLVRLKDNKCIIMNEFYDRENMFEVLKSHSLFMTCRKGKSTISVGGMKKRKSLQRFLFRNVVHDGLEVHHEIDLFCYTEKSLRVVAKSNHGRDSHRTTVLIETIHDFLGFIEYVNGAEEIYKSVTNYISPNRKHNFRYFMK